MIKFFEFSNQLSEVDISDVKGGCKNMSKGDAEKQDADWMMNTDNEIEHQEGTNHRGNCSKGCPYGKNRPFCFPCYKKLMKELYRKRKKDGV